MLDSRGNKLYRNLGDGSFSDVTVIWFTNGAGRGKRGFWGDFDCDGWQDLFLFHEEGFTLFHNADGKRFDNVTEASGLDSKLTCINALLYDYDQDGFADLHVQTPAIDRVFHNEEGRNFKEVRLL